MYLYRGKVYVSFSGRRVRLAGIFVDSSDNDQKKVRIANLDSKGGNEIMLCSEFEKLFTEEVEPLPIIRELTNPKSRRDQSYNPYAPKED